MICILFVYWNLEVVCCMLYGVCWKLVVASKMKLKWGDMRRCEAIPPGRWDRFAPPLKQIYLLLDFITNNKIKVKTPRTNPPHSNSCGQ